MMLHIWSRKCKVYILVIAFCIILITIIIWCILPYDYSHIQTTTHCDTNTNDEEKYLMFPMFTIISGSGIGNQLFEIFSLLGMAQKLNRTAIFNKDDWFLQFKLKNVYGKMPKIAEQVVSMRIQPSETTKYIQPSACCDYNFPSILYCQQSKFLVIDGRFFQSYKYFTFLDSSIKDWLSPSEEDRQKLNSMILEEDVPSNKICVHIRRGDFLTDGQHAGTDSQFTINAIDYLYSLKSGLIFIFSNDQEWVQTEIVDQSNYQNSIRIMTTPTEEPFKDLYFSQIFCDSVLITAPSSTFGWWIGYLSRNQTSVYYRDIREVEDKVKYQMIDDDFFPKRWKKLGMTSENGTIFLKN